MSEGDPGRRARGSAKAANDDVPMVRAARPAARAAVARQSAGSKRKASPSRAAFEKKIIALVYDFDGTLSPRPMQEYAFLPQVGVDAAEFWKETNRVAREQEADPLITYMHLLYKKAKAAGVRIDRHCQELGLLVRPLVHMCVMSPPLVITREQIDTMTGILHEGISRTMRDLRAEGIWQGSGLKTQ